MHKIFLFHKDTKSLFYCKVEITKIKAEKVNLRSLTKISLLVYKNNGVLLAGNFLFANFVGEIEITRISFTT